MPVKDLTAENASRCDFVVLVAVKIVHVNNKEFVWNLTKHKNLKVLVEHFN